MKQLDYIFPNSINVLEKILLDYSIKNIFLVRGNSSFIRSGAEKKTSSILSNYAITTFSDFTVNPKLEEAERGYQLFKKSNSELIIAIGGGSVIDMSKLIKYLYFKDELKTHAFLPLIAIPTTAGTGSESTHFAVVYISKKKFSYADKLLLPNVAIVDSNLLTGQNNYQMAVSGLDAFAQGVESFWSVNSTDESIEYSRKSIKLVWNNLKNAMNGDNQAKEKLAEGSFFAGKAINITKTTAPHAFSYGFTSILGLPHGHAVSLFLPYFISFHKTLSDEDCNDQRGSMFVRNQLVKVANLINTDIDQIEKTVVDFISDLGIDLDFKNLGVTKQVFIDAIEKVSIERLNNNPGKVSSKKILNIYNTYKNIKNV